MAFDREICALTLFCEASSASELERRCVMHVIANRQADGRWGSGLAAICLRREQFSEWNGDRVNNANLLRGAATLEVDPIMADCLAAYSEVVFGQSPDPTNGATHYYDQSIPAPPWAIPPAQVTLRTARFVFLVQVQ